MARFNLAYGNHGETPVQIEDLFCYLRAALTGAGHLVDMSRSIDAGAYNILSEFFSEPAALSVIDAVNRGIKVVVIATELVTGNTFNDFGRNEDDASKYSIRQVWDNRFINFLRIAEACKTVWYLTKEQREGYARVLPSIQLYKLPLGYVEGFIQGEVRANDDKNIDLLFTGSLTRRRQKILRELEASGLTVVFSSPATPTFIRLNLIARSKICLGIKQFNDWPVPSVMRSYYHLMARSLMLSEEYGVASELDSYIIVTKTEKFIETCHNLIKGGNYNEIASKNLDLFRQQVPLRPLFSEFLKANGI